MNEKKLEDWLNSVDSRHRAVLVVAKRAKQLQKGLRPYFDSKTAKVTTMAIEEFVNGKVDYYELSDEEIDAMKKQMVAAREAERREMEKDVSKASTNAPKDERRGSE